LTAFGTWGHRLTMIDQSNKGNEMAKLHIFWRWTIAWGKKPPGWSQAFGRWLFINGCGKSATCIHKWGFEECKQTCGLNSKNVD
jgi:hypothetical protein